MIWLKIWLKKSLAAISYEHKGSVENLRTISLNPRASSKNSQRSHTIANDNYYSPECQRMITDPKDIRYLIAIFDSIPKISKEYHLAESISEATAETQTDPDTIQRISDHSLKASTASSRDNAENSK